MKIPRSAVDDGRNAQRGEVTCGGRNREDFVKEGTVWQDSSRWGGGLLGRLALSTSILSSYFPELWLPVEGTDQLSLLAPGDSWILVLSPKQSQPSA